MCIKWLYIYKAFALVYLHSKVQFKSSGFPVRISNTQLGTKRPNGYLLGLVCDCENVGHITLDVKIRKWCAVTWILVSGLKLDAFDIFVHCRYFPLLHFMIWTITNHTNSNIAHTIFIVVTRVTIISFLYELDCHSHYSYMKPRNYKIQINSSEIYQSKKAILFMCSL